MSYKKKRKRLKTKSEIKVGDLVKPKWAFAMSLKKKEKNWYIPPMGIVTEINYADGPKENIACIEWQKATVPELNAETDDWELERFSRYYTKISVNNLIHYEKYIKSFTIRNKRTLYKK